MSQIHRLDRAASPQRGWADTRAGRPRPPSGALVHAVCTAVDDDADGADLSGGEEDDGAAEGGEEGEGEEEEGEEEDG
eukprot:6045666-Prymnesium_polylepis.1